MKYIKFYLFKDSKFRAINNGLKFSTTNRYLLFLERSQIQYT